jgi:hypothetical protein
VGILRCQHIFNHKSGLAVDQMVNTFYFESAEAASAANAAELENFVDAFYNNVPLGSTASVAQFIHQEQMVVLRETFKWYDMGQPKPRVPVRTSTPTPVTANNTTNGIPSEVAVCLSYHGNLSSGGSRARRSGRIYLGPLNLTAMAEGTNNVIRPAPALQVAATSAGRALQLQVQSAGWNWVVYSQRTIDTEPNSFGTFPITSVWCDDAFDTQRRRGLEPTSRVTLTGPFVP